MKPVWLLTVRGTKVQNLICYKFPDTFLTALSFIQNMFANVGIVGCG